MDWGGSGGNGGEREEKTTNQGIGSPAKGSQVSVHPNELRGLSQLWEGKTGPPIIAW